MCLVGLTVGPEGRQDGSSDQLLHRRLHPPLSVDDPGSLRQTAAELVVPAWTSRREQDEQGHPHLSGTIWVIIEPISPVGSIKYV